MTQSTRPIVPRISQTIALLIILSVACVHAYTGNYCIKDKTICFNISPNGKAEIVVDKVSIAGSYIKTGDNFLVTAKTAANQASKDLVVKKVREKIASSSKGPFDKRQALSDCSYYAKNSTSSNGKFSYNGWHSSVAECMISEEERYESSKQYYDEYKKLSLKELKYSDELLMDFMIFYWTSGALLLKDGMNFTLIGNTLHLPIMGCRSGLALTKPGSKESAFNDYDDDKQFCENNVIYNKCGGKTYKPDKQGCCGEVIYDKVMWSCENNILLPKCGNNRYDEKKQFCSSGNVVKDYGKFTDSRDSKTYKSCYG